MGLPDAHWPPCRCWDLKIGHWFTDGLLAYRQIPRCLYSCSEGMRQCLVVSMVTRHMERQHLL